MSTQLDFSSSYMVLRNLHVVVEVHGPHPDLPALGSVEPSAPFPVLAPTLGLML